MTTPDDQPNNAQGSLFGSRDFRGGADPAVVHLLEAADCPYEPGARLGEGSMAKVFFGTHRQTGRPAAIKIPNGSPWAHERFWGEVDAMDRLDHPHVMPLLQADRKRRWYAMPWAEFSLRQFRRMDPFDWSVLRKALSSVTGGMMHAHANGCVHRDASPDNVLRLRNGHWVLSDFGIAKVLGSSRRGTESGEHFGTPTFSAPEVYADPKSATPAADAWSIGALASWFTSIKPGQSPTSECGRSWLELIEHTMRHNPAERWSMAEIAAHLDRMPASQVLAVVGAAALESCPRCGEIAGRDASERCVSCGFVSEA